MVAKTLEQWGETYNGTPKFVKIQYGWTLNPDFVKLWEPYLDEGLAAKHVAEIFGVNPGSVRKHYPEKVWGKKQILEHSFAVKALNKV